jgi:hypothetical protein
MFEQTTPAHMREMLISHYKLATVRLIFLLHTFKKQGDKLIFI